jgi:hypothetical protein
MNTARRLRRRYFIIRRHPLVGDADYELAENAMPPVLLQAAIT